MDMNLRFHYEKEKGDVFIQRIAIPWQVTMYSKKVFKLFSEMMSMDNAHRPILNLDATGGIGGKYGAASSKSQNLFFAFIVNEMTDVSVALHNS